MEARRYDLPITALALCWFIVTAWFSIGYEHADEHYQVIEFAGTIDDPHRADGLPWEYAARVRPSLQPVIAYAVLSFCDGLSITDPYAKAFVLRLLTAILAVFVIGGFARACRRWIDTKNWTVFLFLSYFLWFVPFICVRFSSETWSGLALLMALTLVIKDTDRRGTLIMAGVLLGLAFLFRFQTLIATTSLLLWSFFIRKQGPFALIAIALPMLVVVGGGVALDSWFYGEFTLAPWNYLRINLIEGKAGSFGSTPWFQYFYLVFRYAFFPIGTAIILAALYQFIHDPRGPITWIILPFLLVHMLIGHKELRFLFPLAPLIPFLLVRAWEAIGVERRGKGVRVMLLGLVAGLMAIDMAAVICASTKPGDIGRMRITQYLHELPAPEGRTVICAPGCDPLAPWGGSPAAFYQEPGTTFRNVDDPNELDTLRSIGHPGSIFLLVNEQLHGDPKVRSFVAHHQLHPLTRSMPDGMVPWLKLYGGFPMKNMLILYGIGPSGE